MEKIAHCWNINYELFNLKSAIIIVFKINSVYVPEHFLDIHQLNLIMEILGTPSEEFMQKITSESVS